jgi:hypothetical protein
MDDQGRFAFVSTGSIDFKRIQKQRKNRNEILPCRAGPDL